MTAPLIKISTGQIIFKGKIAFSDLDFCWDSGESWAILSESGWLQTAFLETLRGNTVVKSGTVTKPFADQYLSVKRQRKEVASFRDLMAYVSQRYEFRNKFNQQNFYFQQRFNSAESEETETVEKYLSTVQSRQVGPWTLEKVLELLYLKDLREESLLKLSNGETRRLAIAAGLMRQPDIFLMDHPTTGLDIESRAAFGELINAIQKEGVQILITCNPQDIPSGIQKIGLLDHTGLAKVWDSSQYTLSSRIEKEKAWNWALLQELLPQEKPILDTLIALQNVTISYQGKIILDAVNWDLKAGERWLLKGANGSGKSTLISLLIGENPQAYSQNIWLFGRKRGTGESIWDIKKPTGFVAPELVRFFPSNQTCKKVILSGLFDTIGLFKKVNAEEEELALKWMKVFELENVAEHPIQRISLDQQRWALLARALIKKPRLLILDEASQGLDLAQRKLFTQTVQKLCELSGISLIFVSHYPEDVPVAVDQIFELPSK